jgi:hypothetical protein
VPGHAMDFFNVVLIFEKKTSIFPKVILNTPGPSKYVSSVSVQFFYAPGHIHRNILKLTCAKDG